MSRTLYDSVGPKRVSVTMSLFADQDDAPREVADERERATLGSGRNDLERLARAVQLLKSGDERGVAAGADLTRTERVVEIADRVVEVEPSPVVVDEVDVRRLGERVGVLMPPVALDGELGARRRVHELADAALPAEFRDRERPDDVQVVDGRHVVEARRDARVLAEVVHDVRRFGHEPGRSPSCGRRDTPPRRRGSRAFRSSSCRAR